MESTLARDWNLLLLKKRKVLRTTWHAAPICIKPYVVVQKC